ncbi:hypothetical protein ANANG_G00261350 [Anguilla anguilla]|uniref:Uncharacterized protein n=1 Tax=Anguilla anguilla TaxID=7936 RepID=A0A9D3LTG5_ANGAN|nr:hypothetical protein ANANG_G00261350 [Anguilla anguilla]
MLQRCIYYFMLQLPQRRRSGLVQDSQAPVSALTRKPFGRGTHHPPGPGSTSLPGPVAQSRPRIPVPAGPAVQSRQRPFPPGPAAQSWPRPRPHPAGAEPAAPRGAVWRAGVVDLALAARRFVQGQARAFFGSCACLHWASLTIKRAVSAAARPALVSRSDARL